MCCSVSILELSIAVNSRNNMQINRSEDYIILESDFYDNGTVHILTVNLFMGVFMLH